MGTRRTWLFEGAADGTTATTALVTCTPGSVAASLVSQGTSSTITFSATHPKEASSDLRWVTAAGSSSVVRLPLAATNMQAAFTFYHYADALPAQDTTIFTGRNSSGIAIRVAVLTTGAVRILDTANGIVATTAAGAWAAGRWNRIALVATVASSTTGVATVNVYNGDGTTPTGTASSTTGNFGTAAFATCDIGIPGTGPTGGWTTYWDAVQMEDGATAEIGAYATPSTPPNLVETEGTFYVVDARSSTATSGGVLSFTLVQTSGPAFTPVVLATGLWKVQQDTSSARVYTLTVTEDTSGLSSTKTVTVPNLSQYASGAEMLWNGTAWE